jgi:hypothetical protein
MSTEPAPESYTFVQPSLEEIASEVSTILMRRLNTNKGGADVAKLLQIVLLTVDETAEVLRVKRKTIQSYISKGIIPVRYVNSEPRFLLSELLAWTLPKYDKHSAYRLAVSASCNITTHRLAALDRRKS